MDPKCPGLEPHLGERCVRSGRASGEESGEKSRQVKLAGGCFSERKLKEDITVVFKYLKG